MDKSDDATKLWSVHASLGRDFHGNNVVEVFVTMADGNICRLATYQGKPYIDDGQLSDIYAVVGQAITDRLVVQGTLLGHKR